MPVTFVIGRSGSGKTERCFSRIIDALRADPLGAPIYWLLPRQATFMAERRLTCMSGLQGFCRARVLSFEQLGTEIFDECGGSAVPQITPIGRQMILGHLLRAHASNLTFFNSVERQSGLAKELDRTFDEFERSGKTVADLSLVLDDLSISGPVAGEGAALANKLHDLRLLYDAYLNFLGQDRLDQHRRLQQVLESAERCSFIPRSTFYVDAFLEFTDHERRMLAAIAKAGAQMEISLLMDPASPLLAAPDLVPGPMGLFHRTETTFKRLHTAFSDAGIIPSSIILSENRRFLDAPDLARLEREFVPSSLPPSRAQTIKSSKSKPTRATAAPLVAPSLFEFAAMAAQARRTPDPPAGIPAIRRIEAPDRIAEVDAVVRSIRGLLSEGYRLRDIAVLVRNLDTYFPPIGKSFGEHGIPYYFIDRRRKAGHHPLLHLLRSALDIARFDWKQEAVFSLMKTGLAGLTLDEADELENYVLLHRVHGAEWESLEPWKWRSESRPAEDDGDSLAEDLARVDRFRRRIAAPLIPLVHLLRDGNPISLALIASSIFTAFDALGVRRTLGQWINEPEAPDQTGPELEERKEHEQIWVKLVDLFEQMVDLLGPIEVTPTDFIDIVESGLEGFDLAITPPAPDQVLVGQVDRTRCPPVKAVFVLGLSEGEFPAPPDETTVLSDRERRELSRRRLELDPDCTRRLLDERLLGYIAFSQAGERLIVSRSVSDARNRPVMPSVFWNRIGEIFLDVPTETIARAQTGDIDQIATPRQFVSRLMRWVRDGQPSANGVDSPGPAPLEFAESEIWPELYQWFATHGAAIPAIAQLQQLAWPALSYSNKASLSSNAREELFASPLSLSVAQLETIAACPFKHFVRYGLELTSRQRAEVGGGDLGQVYHRILEKLFSNAIRANADGEIDLPAISPGEIHDATVKAAKSLRGELMLSNARNRYLLGRIERTIEEIIASQNVMMKHSQFRPSFAGVAFGASGPIGSLDIQTPAGAQASVHGRIDRIDQLPDGNDAIVIDYKLGGDRLSLQHTYYGLSLKLLTDLLAIKSNDFAARPFTPVGAFYVQLQRSLVDVPHPDEAFDPTSEQFHLHIKPRGVFEDSALDNLDPDCDGWSQIVSAFRKKDRSLGNRNSSDTIEDDQFVLLLDHACRRIGELADRILAGDIAIAPYRLASESPCSNCEFHGVCRFETSTNRYHHLTPMNRPLTLQTLAEGEHDAG